MDVTQDTLFNGALCLAQPARGHRIGTDAVLLAAACPRGAARIVDLGCGAGAVGLRAAQVNAAANVALVDCDPAILAIAAGNITANHLENRCRTVAADVFSGEFPDVDSGLKDWADVLLTNPPFAAPGRGTASPDAGRARAHVIAGTLEGWVKAALRCLRPGGTLVMIHRADATGEILAVLARRFGGVRLRFVHPRAGEPAHRVLVSSRKGTRAPLAVLPPLVLHNAEGQFTVEAADIHAGVCGLAAG